VTVDACCWDCAELGSLCDECSLPHLLLGLADDVEVYAALAAYFAGDDGGEE